MRSISYLLLSLLIFPSIINAEQKPAWKPHFSVGIFRFQGSAQRGAVEELLIQRSVIAEFFVEKKLSQHSASALETGFINLKTKSRFNYWKPLFFGYRHIYKPFSIASLEALIMGNIGIAHAVRPRESGRSGDLDREDLIDAFYFFKEVRPYSGFGAGIGLQTGSNVNLRGELWYRYYHVENKYRLSRAILINIGFFF